MARRRYQRGQVYLCGQVWYGRYREDVVREGNTVRVRRNIPLGSKKEYPTKRLAERRMEQELSRINAPEYRPGRVATVAEFAERWKTEILSKQKGSSREAAESHLDRHIIPYLGKLRLEDVGVENQQRFVTHISPGRSRKTVENVVGTLSSMLNTAKNWGYICEGVTLSKLQMPERGVKQEVRTFTADEGRRIIAAAVNPWHTMFALAGYAGLRAGEVLGLRIDDVNLQRGLLRIAQTAWYGEIQSAKSEGSEDVIPIPTPLLLILKSYLSAWKPNAMRLLFINRRGRPFTAEKVVQTQLHPLLDSLGIPRTGRTGFHAFRHMHTTLLLESGASPKVAQRQLRHSDARITLEIYGHLVDDSHRQAVEKMAELLDRSGPNLEPVTKTIQ